MQVDIQLWNYPICNRKHLMQLPDRSREHLNSLKPSVSFLHVCWGALDPTVTHHLIESRLQVVTMSVSTSNDPSEAARLHFESIPWSAALLEPSDVVTFSPPSYSPPDPAGRSISKDELFRNTLNRADAVPACIGFYHHPSGSSNTGTTRLLLDSATLLFDLQPGVNGFQGTVHGGFFAALVDEAMGSYIYLSYRLQTEAKAHGSLPENVMDLDNVNFVTAGLNMKLKKPLPTPQVVTVTSTLAELSGRKLVLHTVIEGEGGIQYAACDGTWIAVPRQRL